jgi:hypothetical protein
MNTWKPIPGYPGYHASKDGQIAQWRRTGRGPYMRYLKPSALKSGHMLVSVTDEQGKSHRRYVHRLVLLAFVGEPEPGMYACHYDDDPSNNALANLRWDTPKGNGADNARNGRSGKVLKVKPIDIHADWSDSRVALAEHHNAILDRVAELQRERATLILELDDLITALKDES